MKKNIVLAVGLFVAVSMTSGKPCSAAVVVGGENGWQCRGAKSPAAPGARELPACATRTSGGGHRGGRKISRP